MPRFPHTRLIACLALTAFCWSSLSAQEATPTAEGALKLLKDGNARFVADKLAKRDTGAKRRAELAKGQKPYAIVLACADSRVAPELIFDQGLGELFVLRVAGNVTDPAILGSIEYAAENLKSPLVVVLGHESCGAVAAALPGTELPGNLGKLIKEVHVGKDLPKDKTAAVAAGVKTNALYQMGQLTQQSTVLKEFAASKRIRIVAGVYSLSTGEVSWLDASTK
jgi:carbonic anhydrase